MALEITATYQLKEEYNDGAYASIYPQTGVDIICRVSYVYENEDIFEDLIMTNITSNYVNGKFEVYLENTTHSDGYWDSVTNLFIENIYNLQLQYMEYILEVEKARIYDASLTEYKEINVATLNYDDIPYDYDCINHSNLVINDDLYNQNPSTKGVFNKDGNVGGSGKNINLSFTALTKNSGETNTGHQLNAEFDLDIHNRRSFQRDEIYRFAIQFMDNLGRKSYPKWMLDCKMPNYTDENYGAYVWQNSGTIYYSFLYPQIQVINIPKNPDGTYMKWRVLRSKREQSDKTVLGTGLIAPTVKGRVWDNSGQPLPYVNYCAISLPSVKSLRGAYYLDMFDDNLPNSKDSEYPTDRQLLEIISPDIQFEKTDLSSAIIQVVGTLDNTLKYIYRLGSISDGDSISTSFSDGTSYCVGTETYKYIQRISKLTRYLKLDTPLTQLRTKVVESKLITPKE